MATSTKPDAKPSSGAGKTGGKAPAKTGAKTGGTRRQAAQTAVEKGKATAAKRGPVAGAARGAYTYHKERKAAGGGLKSSGMLAKGSPTKLVMTEFLLCIVILGFGTIVPTPKGRKDEGVAHLVVKGTALSLLFFILALVASAGGKAEKAASGLGALVTAAYLFTSEDMYNVMTWITSFYAKPGNPQAGSVSSGSGPTAGPPLSSEVQSAAQAAARAGEALGGVAEPPPFSGFIGAPIPVMPQ